MAPSSPLLDHLRRLGAHFEGSEPVHFGRPDEERAAVASGTSLHALTGEAVLEVAGEDAQAFLQAQLSNDVDALSATRAQLSTYCTPQGRMLATLLVWRGADAFLLQLPAELAPSIRTRLQRYVLRAKVRIEDASARWTVLGVAGPQARTVVETAFGGAPAERVGKFESEWGSVICLGRELYQAVLPADGASAQWDRLAANARPAGTQWWRWRLIQANLPVITAATAELFVPQMANMDALGAVSFHKGCYPGQEIVARAQYRGQVKRRLFRLHAGTGAPRSGQTLFALPAASAVGTVVNVAPAPAGGFDILAVLQEESAQRSAELRLGGEHGARLALAP